MRKAKGIDNVSVADQIPIPPIDAIEIERRRKAVDRILELRRLVGPIGIPADELVHEARAEADLRA